MIGTGLGANGGALSGWSHVEQSIRDIVTTPRGTRVMRRDYGCELMALLDRPQNETVVVDFVVAIADALDKWEPRFLLKKVIVSQAGSDGRLGLDLFGIYIPDGHLGGTADDAEKQVSVSL